MDCRSVYTTAHKNKIYNEPATITGGITHITCQHGMVKGFTAMKRGESVDMIVYPCISCLPQRVQAKWTHLENFPTK